MPYFLKTALLGAGRVLRFVCRGWVLPDLPERRIQIAFLQLVFCELVYFGLELVYFGQIVVFANGFPFELLAAHLKSLNYFLEPFPLPFLLAQLAIYLLDLIEHLIETIFHLFLPFVSSAELFLHVVVLQLNFLDLQHLLLNLRGIFVNITVFIWNLQSLAQFLASNVGLQHNVICLAELW